MDGAGEGVSVRLIEPFAGLGAYSLRALWQMSGRNGRAEPPVSRMGSKAGFAESTFKAWGLSRAPWRGVWLNDLDPVCGLFHMVYAYPDLRQAVARRIWAWVPCPECHPTLVAQALEGMLKPRPDTLPTGSSGCGQCNGIGVQDARLLWERLRSEPVPDWVVDAAAVAATLQGSTYAGVGLALVGDDWRMRREDTISTITFDDGMPTATLAHRVDSLPHLAASALYLQANQISGKPLVVCNRKFQALRGDGRFSETPEGWNPSGICFDGVSVVSTGTLAWRVDSLSSGPVTITRLDALACLKQASLEPKDVVILDPPYAGTSGYSADCPREVVLECARLADEAGALCLLHEAVGLASALGKGWSDRPASPLRTRGSSFWAAGEEREWLTYNRAPSYWPAEQVSMF